VGAPRNTKWLNVTQTQQMFEQLSLAYDFGIQRMWILNVGDLKPMEYPIQLFMDMAWNPKEYTQQTVTDHTRRFFEAMFALSSSSATTTYNLQTGEWRQVADDYARLERRALRLYQQVPAAARDAYVQSVLFPVQAMANLYDMYYAQAMNRHLASSGSPDANLWAARVADCFRRDSLLCHDYNKVMAGGKWDGMMTQKHIGYTGWNDDFPRDMLPATTSVPGTTAPTPAASAAGLSALPSGGFTFTPSVGFISIEAEHFFSTHAPEGTAWSIYPYYGRTRSAVALTSYTKPTDGASLSYRFTLPDVRFSPLASTPLNP